MIAFNPSTTIENEPKIFKSQSFSIISLPDHPKIFIY